MKAQKQAAWREVARRVAHEIKNPLTPIALSAERIQRHLDRGTCRPMQHHLGRSNLRRNHCGSGRNRSPWWTSFRLWRDFRLRAPPADINEVIESALSMFNGRLDGIRVHKSLAPDLPKVWLIQKR